LNDKIEIIGYKAFDNDLKCRGFQYEIGKSYKQDGDIQVCENGFHFCENPLDVLSYYDLTTSRFAVVSGSSNSSKCDDDSKIATAEITIKAELKLPDFIKKSVDYLLSACGKETAASGDRSHLAASGDRSQLAASGDCSQLAASGYCSQLAASGGCSQLAASGGCSQLAASGDCSQLAASGDRSQLAASGYRSQLAASGGCSQLAASGDCSQLAASGDDSVVMSCGLRSKAKAGKDGAIALTYKDEHGRFRIAVGYIGEGLKAGTFYKVNSSGEFLELSK